MTEPNKPTERDPVTGADTTGHEWDGIKELDNRVPRWSLWVFLLTVLWSIGYWVVYPAWPTLSGHTKGALEWTQRKQLSVQQAEILARQQNFAQRLQETPIEQVHLDAALYEFARTGGAAMFKENCAACHGSGGEGRKGYPNLNDDDWIWGGTLAQIQETIRVGIRSGHDQTRMNIMPAFGKDGILKQAEINAVASFVEKLQQGDKASRDEVYTRGEAIFAEHCAACHGSKGDGDPTMGAPRLNDAIWLYGGRHADIVRTISQAYAGVMPAWDNRLDENTIKQLTIYIHSLGGGQ